MCQSFDNLYELGNLIEVWLTTLNNLIILIFCHHNNLLFTFFVIPRLNIWSQLLVHTPDFYLLLLATSTFIFFFNRFNAVLFALAQLSVNLFNSATMGKHRHSIVWDFWAAKGLEFHWRVLIVFNHEYLFFLLIFLLFWFVAFTRMLFICLIDQALFLVVIFAPVILILAGGEAVEWKHFSF